VVCGKQRARKGRLTFPQRVSRRIELLSPAGDLGKHGRAVSDTSGVARSERAAADACRREPSSERRRSKDLRQGPAPDVPDNRLGGRRSGARATEQGYRRLPARHANDEANDINSTVWLVNARRRVFEKLNPGDRVLVVSLRGPISRAAPTSCVATPAPAAGVSRQPSRT